MYYDNTSYTPTHCTLILITGILAVVWPCGIITMIGELFGAESLSQVYAFLHTFLGIKTKTVCQILLSRICLKLTLYAYVYAGNCLTQCKSTCTETMYHQLMGGVVPCN